MQNIGNILVCCQNFAYLCTERLAVPIGVRLALYVEVQKLVSSRR